MEAEDIEDDAGDAKDDEDNAGDAEDAEDDNVDILTNISHISSS